MIKVEINLTLSALCGFVFYRLSTTGDDVLCVVGQVSIPQ